MTGDSVVDRAIVRCEVAIATIRASRSRNLLRLAMALELAACGANDSDSAVSDDAASTSAADTGDALSTTSVGAPSTTTALDSTGDGDSGSTSESDCVRDCPPEDPPPRDVIDFLDALHELDDLPRLGTGTSEMVSTWDRSGGLADGWDFSEFAVDGDAVTLLSVDGPGCIHRFSTGEASFLVVGTRIQIELDGELLVDVPVEEFFDPALSPFAGPLVHAPHYPTVRMPIPFSAHAEVRLVATEGNLGNFWQIAYSRYDAQAQVQTLRLPLSGTELAAFDAAGMAWTDALVGDHPPPLGSLTSAAATLAADDRLSFDDLGCGTIDRLEIELAPDTPAAWRDTRLRITWDDAAEPAVDLPVATFMVGPEYGDDPTADFDSLIAGVSGGRAYLRLPMPYRTAASVELHNTGVAPIDATLDVWTAPCREQPVDFGWLHAAEAAAPAGTPESPVSGPYDVPGHVLLDRAGRGKIVGTTMRVDWPYVDKWWGEGDWQIWIDQDARAWPPAYHGTGTEEFYDGGWTQFSRKAVSGVVKPRPGLVTVFGFLLSDAFDYQQGVRMQVETLGLNDAHALILTTNPVWDTTVYWYDAAP